MHLPLSVLLLPPNEAFRSKVAEAFLAEEVHLLESWADLGIAIGATASLPVLIADPMERGSGDGLDPDCPAVLRLHPEVPFVAAVDTHRIAPSQLIQLGQWGASEVICTSQAGSGEIRRVVLGTHSLPLIRLFERFRDRTSPRGWRILIGAAAVGASGGSVPQLAQELLVAERTLARYCKLEGLPSPRRLLAWVRVLRAVQLLQSSSWGVGRIAYAAGYANESGLRRTCYDLLGTSPSQLRGAEGLREAIATLEENLFGGRR